MMQFVWYGAAALLIAVGLAGAIVPAVPGIPLIFGGIWLMAGADHYRHLGPGWLIGIAVIGTIGMTADLLAAALGARRVGASAQAVWGALAGTVIGVAFGLPGLLLGPFIGAVAGELAAGRGAARSAQVGIGTWLGMMVGALIKLVASLLMVVLLGAGWWWRGYAGWG